MKKIILTVLISLTILVSVFAADPIATQTSRAELSFVADLHSIFGFTREYVGPNTVTQPEVLTGDIKFEPYISSNLFRTEQFYVYYQKFTNNNIKITLNVDDNGESDAPVWTDTVGQIQDGNGNNLASNSTSTFTVYDSSRENVRFGSKSLILEIDASNMGNIDWSAKYEWTLQLKIEENT